MEVYSEVQTIRLNSFVHRKCVSFFCLFKQATDACPLWQRRTMIGRDFFFFSTWRSWTRHWTEYLVIVFYMSITSDVNVNMVTMPINKFSRGVFTSSLFSLFKEKDTIDDQAPFDHRDQFYWTIQMKYFDHFSWWIERIRTLAGCS